jgi:hypothetical protein
VNVDDVGVGVFPPEMGSNEPNARYLELPPIIDEEVSYVCVLCCVMFCYDMSYYVILCYVTLCHVMLCYIMLCYGMLHNIILQCIIMCHTKM